LHHHVGAELTLDVDGPLGREDLRRAVHVRLEDDLVVVDPAQVGQREDLKAPAVGKEGPVPAHHEVQPAEVGYHVGAGAEHQVIRIAQDHLRPSRANMVGRDALDRPRRADRHEHRRLNLAMRRRKFPSSGFAVGRDNIQ